MVEKKTKIGAVAAASFGVAMSSMYVSSGIQADVLDITYSGGNASSVNGFVTYGGISVFIDQVPNAMTSFGSEIGQFFQWNDTFGTDGIGRTMELGIAASAAGPMSMRVAEEGEVIDPATFVGQLNAAGTAPMDIGVAGNGNTTLTTFHGSGSAFIAVRPLEAPGNLYWFRCTFTDQGPITYLEGQYGDAGEALTVGGKAGCDADPGDVNRDGNVDILDVAPFVDAITGDFDCAADVNGDGAVDILDVAPFVALLTGG